MTYTLLITVGGNSLQNPVVTDILPPQVAFASFGTSPLGTVTNVNPTTSTLTWALPALSPGTYMLTYTTTVNDLLPGGTSIANGAVLAFTGGAPLSSAVTVQVTGDYTVRVGVYNEAGELVKIIFTKKYSQPINNITLSADNVISSLNDPINVLFHGTPIGAWDGTNAGGDPAPNGTYYIKVDNVDSMGSVTTVTQQAVVSRSLYKSTVLVYNSAGEIVRHLYSYVDDPGLAGVSGVQLSTSVIKPSYGQPAGVPSEVTISLSNGTTVVWDGRSDTGVFVQSGQYFLEIHSSDGTGGDATVTKQVSVQDADRNGGMGDVLILPNVVEPAKKGGAVTFTTAAGANLSLRARVYTMAGELVTALEGVPGSGIIAWNAAGLASGLYITVVEVKDGNGAFMGRQTKKIIIRR